MAALWGVGLQVGAAGERAVRSGQPQARLVPQAAPPPLYSPTELATGRACPISDSTTTNCFLSTIHWRLSAASSMLPVGLAVRVPSNMRSSEWSRRRLLRGC